MRDPLAWLLRAAAISVCHSANNFSIFLFHPHKEPAGISLRWLTENIIRRSGTFSGMAGIFHGHQKAMRASRRKWSFEI
jgi:hypothetical protein